MLLAKIVGTVVATRKDPRLVSSKLLVVAADRSARQGRRQLPRRRRHGRRRRRRNRAHRQRQLGADGVRPEGLSGRRRHRRHHRHDRGQRRERPDHAARESHRRRRGDAQGREPRGHQAADRAAADARAASRPGGRSSRSMRSAPASARRCFSSAARKRAFRSIRSKPPVDAGIVGIVDHWDLG